MTGKNADDDDTTKMTRDNILLRRRAVPKRVTLPDGRTFYATYERISHRQLPRNIPVKRKRAIGPRRQRWQRGGWMISSLFYTGLKFGSKIFKLCHRTKNNRRRNETSSLYLQRRSKQSFKSKTKKSSRI